MKITGFQAKEECGSIELCSVLATGLEGGIHIVCPTLKSEAWVDQTVDSDPT